MRWWIYQILFAVAYVAMLPKFLFRMARRGGYADRFADRFGRYPADVSDRLKEMAGDAVWIHAVSVGEVSVAAEIMNALRKESPAIRFVLSTTSSTGWMQAQKAVSSVDEVLYCPLDFPPCVRRALDTVRPRAFILTETEIWPNLIRACHNRGIPLFLVNARVSDRSAPGYRRLRFWFGPALRCFARIYAQSRLDAGRLIDAGASPATVEIAGSMKFDAARRNPAVESRIADYLAKCGLDCGHIMLLGGSTWPGEDRMLMELYLKLRNEFTNLRLAIVPRHFEKADAVEENARSLGLGVLRKSRSPVPGADDAAAFSGGRAIVLADTTGELAGFYARADMAVVGKTFLDGEPGGQNMIEPCLCGCATVVGPHTENFRPVMSDLLDAGALVQVANPEEMEEQLRRWLSESGEREAQRNRAASAVAARGGVAGRCAKEICAIVEAKEGRCHENG